MLTLAVLMLAACRGAPQQGADDRDLARLVDSLRAPVEQAAGMRFTSTPRSAMRSREQVRAYLMNKLDEELTPARLRGQETAYRLFGLLSDTLQLRPLLLDIYTEQVAGYYDPDSTTFFGVEGSARSQLRLVLAHEMVHALQGQHLPLDSILKATANNDRLAAAQAILEGQATLASIDVLAPGQGVSKNPQFWEMYRDQVQQQQGTMPVFARAPLVIRQALIFPYLDGAEFMHWWMTSRHSDTLPYGPRMPISTEQILHPDRYDRADEPVALAIAGPPGIYEDALGESEIRVLIAALSGSDEVQTVMPVGWGGDRFRVYDTRGGPALVWCVVWDDARSRERFLRGSGAALRATGRKGYRAVLDTLIVGSRPATRYVLAPEVWEGWKSLPEVMERTE
ncbi:MAG TPA: hypothetical protein VIG08_02700 [Gemmatimonadales bacterium]